MRIRLVAALVLCSAWAFSAPIIWDGSPITFTKPDHADWTLPVNQDHLTPNVVITRKDTRGIYNIAVESGYIDHHNREGQAAGAWDSPFDTEWAFGSLSDWDTLTYESWVDWNGFGPFGNMVGKDAVLHLISDDIYLALRFESWTSGDPELGDGGGGFSYVRSTPSADGQIPEPATLSLLGIALAALLRRRKRRA